MKIGLLVVIEFAVKMPEELHLLRVETIQL